jgi:hypothetical protein
MIDKQKFIALTLSLIFLGVHGSQPSPSILEKGLKDASMLAQTAATAVVGANHNSLPLIQQILANKIASTQGSATPGSINISMQDALKIIRQDLGNGFEGFIQNLEGKTAAATPVINPADVTAITQKSQTDINSWVVSTLLEENLQHKQNATNQTIQKYIAGVVAVILPVAVGLIQHYVGTIGIGSC